MNSISIINNLYDTNAITKEQLVHLLRDDTVTDYLFKIAKQKTCEVFGNAIYIRGILEFSSYCRCRCSYCGINACNKSVTRYRMTEEQIINVAEEVYGAGYKTLVLQSGEDAYYTREKVCNIIKGIKEKSDIVITLSIGERSFDDYKVFFDCGATRYLLKHEVANEELYNSYHPHSNFENRLRCLTDLGKIGYEVGSGFMVGLPGQTIDMLADDILLLKSLNVKMAGISPYICHPQTPLGDSDDGSIELTIKAVAIARLLLPNSYLPSTTALNIKSKSLNALECGANVIMQKATPKELRDFYEIYPGRESEFIEYGEQYKDLQQQLIQMGYHPQ